MEETIDQQKEGLKSKKPSKVVLKDIADVFFQEREYDFNRLEKSFNDQTKKLAQLGVIMRNQAISFRNVEKIIKSQYKFNEKIHREDYQIEQRNDMQFQLLSEQNTILKQILNKIGGKFRKKSDEGNQSIIENVGQGAIGGAIGAGAGSIVPIFIKRLWALLTWPFRFIWKKLGKMISWPIEKILGKEIVEKFSGKTIVKLIG